MFVLFVLPLFVLLLFLLLQTVGNVFVCCLFMLTNNSILFCTHTHTEIALLCFFFCFFSFFLHYSLFLLGFNRSALRTFIAVLCADVSVSFETRALTEPTRLAAAIEIPKTCSAARSERDRA